MCLDSEQRNDCIDFKTFFFCVWEYILIFTVEKNAWIFNFRIFSER